MTSPRPVSALLAQSPRGLRAALERRGESMSTKTTAQKEQWLARYKSREGKAIARRAWEACEAARTEELAGVREKLEFIAGGCLVPPDGGSPNLRDAIESAREALEILKGDK